MHPSLWIEQTRVSMLEFLQATRNLRVIHEALGQRLNMATTLDELLADHGEVFERRARLPKHQVFPQSRQCYWNAWQHLSSIAPGALTYCEGYVAIEGVCIPVMHGWCIDDEGVVHDPSVDQSAGALYVGLRFKEDLAKECWSRLEPMNLIGILPNLPLIGVDLKMELDAGNVWASNPLGLKGPSEADLRDIQQALCRHAAALPSAGL